MTKLWVIRRLVSSGSTLSKQKFRRSSGHRFVKVEGLVLHSRSCRTETLGRLRPQFYFASGDTNVFTGTSETGAKIHRACVTKAVIAITGTMPPASGLIDRICRSNSKPSIPGILCQTPPNADGYFLLPQNLQIHSSPSRLLHPVDSKRRSNTFVRRRHDPPYGAKARLSILRQLLRACLKSLMPERGD